MGRHKKNTTTQTNLFVEEMKDTDQEISDRIDKLNVGDEPTAKERIDVFNEAEPEENSYIHDEGFTEEASVKTKKGAPRVDFAEPTSFTEAFDLPEDEVSGDTKGAPKTKKPKPEPKPAMNPAFDDMSKAKQKKQSKLFAKMVVEGVCSLAELGFVWYATKDTSEAKLIDYELSGEINLQILISLGDEQEMTIKSWFQSMNLTASQLAVVSQEDKDDLADALSDVMLEEGIAPTPVQTLLIVMVKVFIIDKGKALLYHKIEIGRVLNQFKAISSGQKAEQEQVAQRSQARQQQQEVKNSDPVKEDEPELTPTEEIPADDNDSTKFLES